jgi:hypothetical protein
VKNRGNHQATEELLLRLWDVQQALEELLEAGDDETIPFSEDDLIGMQWTVKHLTGAVEGCIRGLAPLRDAWEAQYARPAH